MRKDLVKVISGIRISALFITFSIPVFSQNPNHVVTVKLANCKLAANVSRSHSNGQFRWISVYVPQSISYQDLNSELNDVIRNSGISRNNIIEVLAFSNLISTDSILTYDSDQINGYLIYFKSKEGYKTRVYKKVSTELQEIKQLRTFNSHIFCDVTNNLEAYLRPTDMKQGAVFILEFNELNNVLPNFVNNFDEQLQKLQVH